MFVKLTFASGPDKGKTGFHNLANVNEIRESNGGALLVFPSHSTQVKETPETIQNLAWRVAREEPYSDVGFPAQPLHR